MKRKVLAVIMSCGLAATSLTGCGSTSSTESSASSGNSSSSAVSEISSAEAESVESGSGSGSSSGGITIGFCNYGESMDFFKTVKESMERACEANGDKLLYATSDADAGKMRSNWDSFVSQGADIIVDASILGDAGSSLATQYKNEGKIPVVSVDNVYENAYFFGVNNQGAGEAAGEYLAQKVKEKWDGQVDCMLQFFLASNGEEVQKRNQGIYDGMVANGVELSKDKVDWVNAQGTAQSGYDPAVMKSLVSDYLSAHPDDHHIVIGCFNDDGGSAAYNAAKGAGREDDVMIVSHNADQVALDNLSQNEENCWIATVSYQPQKYGDQIVDLCEKIVAGDQVDDQTYAEVLVVDHDNAADYIAGLNK